MIFLLLLFSIFNTFYSQILFSDLFLRPENIQDIEIAISNLTKKCDVQKTVSDISFKICLLIFFTNPGPS